MSSPSIQATRRRPKTLREARELIASIHPRVTSTERIAVHDCNGRCLAEDVIAPINLPMFDVAAMDGYAVRSEDVATTGRTDLLIVGEIAAGHPLDRQIGVGESARIYTGALIPAGADRVITQENCIRTGDRVSLVAHSAGKPHIRRSGEDVLAGQKVLASGIRLGPAQLALLAGLRLETVPVLRRLRVALLSVGDELSNEVGSTVHGGIIDSNRPMLKGWLEGLGCVVEDLGIIPDSAEILLQRLIDVAANADLIITSGGASVGPADHLARLIARRGFLEFWKLEIRPGKPVGFGDIDDCPILALPGNPFAAATAFTLIGRVLIAQLSGDSAARPSSLILPLAQAVSKRGNHLQVMAARLTVSAAGTTAVEPLNAQGSASLVAIGGAQGLLLLPEDREEYSIGEAVEFVPI